jgi:probable rRNA maturation factor
MPTKAGSANSRKQLIVTVQIATHRRGIPHARTLAAWAQSAFTAAAVSKRVYQPLALTIRIVGSAESRRLNRVWRGKDKPTNVLSFPASSGQKGAPTQEESELGDLAICAPVVRREAREQGKAVHAHWAHMIVHGLLHLLGYDHEDERDAERMEGLEIRILARMGIDNPYLDALAA